jgi:small subunit ribosomal protein S1
MENLTSPAPPAAPTAASPEQAAPSGENSFADILSEFEQQHHGPARGQATQGTVVSITADAVFVDIGRKIDGILPTQLFRDEAGRSPST